MSQLPDEGAYITTSAGVEPVLILRDNDGVVRAFRNVCRHRGSRLLSGSGECGKAIRCRYHGWTYRFDGTLIGVPEGRSIPGLDKSKLGLFPRGWRRCAAWCSSTSTWTRPRWPSRSTACPSASSASGSTG